MLYALAFVQAAFAGPVFLEPQVSEQVLAEQRGGIRLPNGIDIALTIQTQTALNGAIILRTVVKVEQTVPHITVYTPENGREVEAPNSVNLGDASPPASATVSYDRVRGITVNSSAITLPVSVISGTKDIDSQVPDGLHAVDLTGPIQTDNGILTSVSDRGLNYIELSGGNLDIKHFTGNAFGSAIANSGNDRVIDTQTTASIDLRNVGPDVLGSAMLRVESVALDALASRM